jgi:DNA repair protein RadC
MSRVSSPTTDDVLHRLNFIRYKRQEYFICLSLDSGGRIIKRRTVTIGLLTATLVHPREVFAGPLQERAAGVIVAHNHPSGSTEPSQEDIKTTQQLVAAGQILGLAVNDHLIVTRDSEFSFKQHLLIL